MTREQLIESALALRVPGNGAAEEFEARREAIAAEVNRQMLARADVARLIGAGNEAMMVNNSHNMLRFMSSLFRAFDGTVLTETALWVFRTYRAHGFAVAYWPASLDTTIEILRLELSAQAFSEVCPSFEWLIVNIPAFVALTDELGRTAAR